MIKLEKTQVFGFEAAIRGMRNPMNSWDKSDTFQCDCVYPEEQVEELIIGQNDEDLMRRLNKGGPVHAKYRRMIVTWVDVTAPLRFWKDFDTYRFGRERNSCSTMHKIQDAEFTEDTISNEHLLSDTDAEIRGCYVPVCVGESVIKVTPRRLFNLTLELLNRCRTLYFEALEDNNDTAKDYWWQMIELLPDSYNMKSTIMISYEALASIYRDRRNHKQDEWREFCKWIETLPNSWIITGKVDVRENVEEEDSSKISMYYDEDGDYIVATISKKMAINLNVVIKGEESGLYYEDDFIGICKELHDNGDKVDLYFKLMPNTDGTRIVEEYNAQKLRFICIMGAKDRFIYKHLDNNRRGVFEEVHGR